MKPILLIRFVFLLPLFCSLSLRSQNISGIINSYYQVTAINTLTNTLTVNNTNGLTAGSKVLLIQMKGATIDNSNTATYGNITALNNAGNYEFNYVCGINGNEVMLRIQLMNSYTTTEPLQLVSVPVYTSVTVSDTITSTPWDPVAGTGGIVVMEANTITLNSVINVSGQGFQGGTLVNYGPPDDCLWSVNVTNYYLSDPPSDIYHTGGMKGEGITDYIAGEQYGRGKLASGGGGGNNNNTGGAGGGNYGAGGNGGERTMESFFKCHGYNPGVGGLSLSPYGYSTAQNRIFLGGGGGSGHENNGVGLPGGNGGGIVMLTANLLTGNSSSILANGVSPLNPGNPDPTQAEGDGGGGGGAGGTVIINAVSVTGSIGISVNGANGSNSSYDINDCTGPGGGGGGGIIWSEGAIFPTAISSSINGGSNGVVSSTSTIVACRGSANSATPGVAGIALTGYTAPLSTDYVCDPLPIAELKYFNGVLTAGGALLSWGMNETANISWYRLESSANQVSYDSLAGFSNNGNKSFNYMDDGIKDGTTYYRLVLINKDGSTEYSQVIALTKNSSVFQFVGIQPNPAINMLTAVMYSTKIQNVEISVYNAYGQKMNSIRNQLNTGYSKINIPVTALAQGTYFLQISGDNFNLVRPFLKEGGR